MYSPYKASRPPPLRRMEEEIGKAPTGAVGEPLPGLKEGERAALNNQFEAGRDPARKVDDLEYRFRIDGLYDEYGGIVLSRKHEKMVKPEDAVNARSVRIQDDTETVAQLDRTLQRDREKEDMGSG